MRWRGDFVKDEMRRSGRSLSIGPFPNTYESWWVGQAVFYFRRDVSIVHKLLSGRFAFLIEMS